MNKKEIEDLILENKKLKEEISKYKEQKVYGMKI